MVHDVVTVASLALSIPTIVSAFLVVWLWLPPALAEWRSDSEVSANGYFMLGVAVGFVGSLIDNVYWGAAWTAEFHGSPLAEPLFQGGVYSNLLFRQTCGLAAAYLHLRAADVSHVTAFRWVNRAMTISHVLAALFAVYLWWSKG